MDALLADLRFAARSLFRRRTFAIVAIATIALAIGSATSIFSVVDAVLFRSLPYRDPARLVSVWQTYPKWRKDPILARGWDRIPLDYGEFLEWRRKQTVFSSIGLWAGTSFVLTNQSESEQVDGVRVSPSLFDVLGVKPVIGRVFLPGEDVINGPRVTVVSYDTWTVRYGRRRDILGKTVSFDGVPYTIVGVLPRGLELGRGQPAPPFWTVAGQSRSDVGSQNHSFRGIARLAPGVSLERATLETTQLLQGSTSPAKRGVRLAEYQRDATRDVRQPLLVLLAAVGLLLLIACVNIGTLLLGEAATREQEMAARAALGATRRRLLRQLLTESLLLAVIGGAAGTTLAWWGTKLLVALAPDGIPGIRVAHVDLRVLVVALLVTGATGLLFGLAPALAMARSTPGGMLRSGGQSRRGRGRLQRIMIATELALSVVLLIGAVLLARSLRKLTSVDPGFRADHLLAVRVNLPRSFGSEAVRTAFLAEATTRVGGLPGVAAVTAIDAVPFTGRWSSSGYVMEGFDASNLANRHTAQQRIVLPNYFSALGIPMLAGRAFTSADREGASLVAIISESAARRDWPNESPIGKRVTFHDAVRTIVGVVGDTKYSKLSAADEPTIYTPHAQSPNDLWLLVRTRDDPAAMGPVIRRALHDVSAAAVVVGADTMTDLIRRSFSEERFRTMLIALFGVMAGVLAAVGMYGVTARAVNRRTREVGIRVALGATPGSVIRLIAGQTLTGVAIGVALGTAAAVGASRLLAPYLYGVDAHDPVTYSVTFGALAAISLCSSWIAARRAGRVPPALVLRGD